MSFFLFIIAIIVLIVLSYGDYLFKTINNKPIFVFGAIGLIISLFTHNFLATVLGMALMTIFGWVLWQKEAVGGADAKILIALVPYLPFLGIPNMLATLLLFIIIFGLIGLIYAMIWKKGLRLEVDEIPFVPAIMLSYAILYFYRF